MTALAGAVTSGGAAGSALGQSALSGLGSVGQKIGDTVGGGIGKVAGAIQGGSQMVGNAQQALGGSAGQPGQMTQDQMMKMIMEQLLKGQVAGQPQQSIQPLGNLAGSR